MAASLVSAVLLGPGQAKGWPRHKLLTLKRYTSLWAVHQCPQTNHSSPSMHASIDLRPLVFTAIDESEIVIAGRVHEYAHKKCSYGREGIISFIHDPFSSRN